MWNYKCFRETPFLWSSGVYRSVDRGLGSWGGGEWIVFVTNSSIKCTCGGYVRGCKKFVEGEGGRVGKVNKKCFLFTLFIGASIAAGCGFPLLRRRAIQQQGIVREVLYNCTRNKKARHGFYISSKFFTNKGIEPLLQTPIF